MAPVRNASLFAHAASMNMREYILARSAARAAGQTVATAHVPTHSMAAAIYAATAVRDASVPTETEAAMIEERTWQYQHLLEMMEKR